MSLDLLNQTQRRVYHAILDAARNGEMAPLTGDLCRTLRASSDTIRGAIKAIEHHGLFKTAKGRNSRWIIRFPDLGIATADVRRSADAEAELEEVRRLKAIEFRKLGWTVTDIQGVVRCPAGLIREWLQAEGFDMEALVPGRRGTLATIAVRGSIPWPAKTMDHDRDWPAGAKFEDDPRAPKSRAPKRMPTPDHTQFSAVSSSAAWGVA